MAQYIYTLEKARKAHGDKVVLDDVTLAFLPGAKIGVVGPNGAGKSSLLRIMAGDDQPSNGEARLMPGYTVGHARPGAAARRVQDRSGNIEQAVAETKAKLARFNEIAEQMATDYSDELMDEMGKLQEELDHSDAWDIDSKLEQAMDALRCPPPDADVDPPLRRRAAPGRAVQAAAGAARPAAARRAHQPPRRRERAVAGAAPGEVPGHRRGDHPRPVLPRQRRPVDPRARPRPRLPLRGQLLHLPGEEGGPAAVAGPQGRQAAASAWRTSCSGCARTPRRARPSHGPGSDRYEEMASEAEKTRKLDFEEIQIPPGPRLGNLVIEAKQSAAGRIAQASVYVCVAADGLEPATP